MKQVPAIVRWIDRMFEHAHNKQWYETYWAFDIHGTIMLPNFKRGNTEVIYYDYAKETLKLLSGRDDIIMMILTSSYPEELKHYQETFRKDKIFFDYINENPEICEATGGFGHYEKKPYFNVFFDDKAGFFPEEDWYQVYQCILKWNEKKPLPEWKKKTIIKSVVARPLVYPTADIAIMRDNDTVLLGRKKHQDKYRFIGGFTDVEDEDWEHTARRETKEETGLEINNIEYIGSYKIDDPRYRDKADKIITTLFYAKKIAGNEKASDDMDEVKWFVLDGITKNHIVAEHHVLFEALIKFVKRDTVIQKTLLSDSTIIVYGSDLTAIKALMTPAELLVKKEFEKPLAIHPKEFVCFDDLVRYRDKIRVLKLVPIKNEEMREHYNSLDKKKLLGEIDNYLKSSPITLALNEFPYWLPKECEQYLIWIRKGTGEGEVINFIAKATKYLNISPKELILFERPLDTKSFLVKGTFRYLRHIHFWTRKKK